MAESKAEAEALIPRFRFERVLNQDQKGSRLSLLGTIYNSPALLLLERAAFPSDSSEIKALLSSIVDTSNLGANDVYRWYMGNTASSAHFSSEQSPPSLKINLIYPCTASHIKKYTPSRLRMVTETPDIYAKYTLPYLKSLRAAGKLNWIFNILEGRAEQEDVILRHSDPIEGFLLAPDLNWDRKTLTSLHMLALVERRDIWSLRDLTKAHVGWLKHMREALINATTKCYPNVDEDELKLYIHCSRPSYSWELWLTYLDQPTYAHFHVHIVHVATTADAGSTQANGKAFGLENVISQLETMAGGDKAGMKNVSISYFAAEGSEIWEKIWGPLKRGEIHKIESGALESP
jgi:m7GpppX diphosphatase